MVKMLKELFKPYYYENYEELKKWRNINIPLGIPLTYPDRLNRIDNIKENYDIKICIFGCSFAYGLNLRFEDSFGYKIKKHFEKENKTVGLFNLSVPGGSNDLIARNAICAIPFIKPDYTIIAFTFPERREGIDRTGQIRTLMANQKSMFKDNHSQKMLECRNVYSDITNFLINYKAIEGVANQYGKWTYSTMTEDVFEFYSEHFDKQKYAGDFDLSDQLWDGHPGPKANEKMKEKYLKVLLKQ